MTRSSAQPNTEVDLAELNADFLAARGEAGDVKWVRAAEGRLMLDGVKALAATDALTELLPVLRDAKEPAEELFGDPAIWAREQQERWHQSGIQAYDRNELLSLGRFLQVVFFSAVGVAVAVTIITLFSDGWMTELSWTVFTLPVIISAAGLGFQQVWSLAVRHSSRIMAMVWAAVFLIASSLILGGLAAVMPESAGIGSTLWYLAPTPLYALLSFASRVVSKRKRTIPERFSADAAAETKDEWIQQLREQLRLRNDLSDRQIRVITDETRAYATDAETSLHEEFGTPESYAASFAPNTSYRARRAAWGWTAGSVLIAALVVASTLNAGTLLTWQTVIFAALLLGTLFYAVQSWHQSLTSS